MDKHFAEWCEAYITENINSRILTDSNRAILQGYWKKSNVLEKLKMLTVLSSLKQYFK